MSSLSVRTPVITETAVATAAPTQQPITGTSGLGPRDVALYRQVVATEIKKLQATKMVAQLSPEASAALGNMIIAAQALNGGDAPVKPLPAALDVAKYDAVIQAHIKAITDVLRRARFAAGAQRAKWDIVASFENLLH